MANISFQLDSGFRSGKYLRRLTGVAAFGCLLCTGCYSGDNLILLAKSKAIRTRVSEVQLGDFETTIPRDADTGAQVMMEFSIYATAPHYRTPALEAMLETDGYRLRYAILTAIRQANADELADPEFTALRARLSEEANKFFGDATIGMIGLSNVRVVHY